MSSNRYDDPFAEARFGRTSPVAIWSAVMVAALIGAGATLWRGGEGPGFGGRLVASIEPAKVQEELRTLGAERAALAERVARLERGLGELRIAANAAVPAPETTGSIERRPLIEPSRSGAFGVSLGPDASAEAVGRRWRALSARYPDLLGRLSARASRGRDGLFDLVVGPFQADADARRACATLADQGVACDTTAYAGEPVARS